MKNIVSERVEWKKRLENNAPDLLLVREGSEQSCVI